MDDLHLSIDAGWAAGLLLAHTRVAAFVVASPLLGRAVPLPARLGFVVAVGYFLASPVGDDLSVAALLAAGTTNAAVGAVLGWLTGLVFHLFPVAGSLIDLSSGLSVASVFDPSRGETGAVFARLLNLTATALFYVSGGLALLVSGLAWSVKALPLDGAVRADPGLATLATDLVGRLMVAGLEVALPVVGALFLAEVVLGLASRLVPQANVFLVGLPAKLMLTLSMATVAFAAFPEAMDGLLAATQQTFADAVRGLTPGR